MKNSKNKFLSLAIILFFTFLSTTVAHAESVWRNFSAGFSAGRADYPSLVLDSSGTPYVAFVDYLSGEKVTVMKWNGISFEDVGSPRFSSNVSPDPYSSDTYTDLALDSSNTPYVVYPDSNYGGKATVMKYNGSAWVNVGTPGFSTGQAMEISIKIDSNNIPYVSYKDDSSGRMNVKKYNGSAWVSVGSADFSTGTVITPSMAIDSINTPYVAYADGGVTGTKATVMKYNGSAWVNVGSAGFSPGYAPYISIAINSNDVPYVLFYDNANGARATSMKFNGSTWELVGSAGFSESSIAYNSLTFDSNDVPYAAYYRLDTGRLSVSKYNGSAWELVGSHYFTTSESHFVNIALNSNDLPYVLFRDRSFNYKATLMFFDEPIAPTVSTNSASSLVDTSADLNGNITDAGGNVTTRGFQIGLTNEYTMSLISEDGDFTQGDFSLQATGLRCDTTYHYRAYALNSVGTAYGSDSTFTTTSVTPCIPTLTTQSSSSITTTTATLTGNITATGGEANTERGFDIGTDNTYTMTDVADATGSYSTGAYSLTATGLTCGTIYHYRAYSTNTAGTGTGSDDTLTTSACPVTTSTSLDKRISNLREMGKTKEAQDLASQFPNIIKPTASPILIPILTKSLKQGNANLQIQVKILQKALGLKEDGKFGPKTFQAVKEFQKNNGLKPDGIVGPMTWGVINKH